MAITFPVDDVQLQGEPHPLVGLKTSLRMRTGERVHAYGGPESVVSLERGINPLIAAVHLAFSSHRPLVLSPDVVWTAIAQGFPSHVLIHADELRERLVKHKGKISLEVNHSADSVAPDAWSMLVRQFTEAIRSHVGPGLHRLLVNDFSTTGDLERTASEIGMMETFSPYFNYNVICICGIPTITLSGTVDDWRTIRRRLDVIAEYGLADWIARLAPVADEWVKSAAGQPDRDFWQCMYMPEEAYGSKLVTGWLVRLFPYIGEGRKTRNEALYGPVTRSTKTDGWVGRRAKQVAAPGTPRWSWQHDGVRLSAFGSGLSVAPVTLRGRNNSKEYVKLLGGLIGVTQDSSTLSLEPRLGWCVCPDNTAATFQGLAATARPVTSPSADGPFHGLFIPAEYIKLLDQLVNSRSLFGGAWTLRTRGEIVVLKSDATGHKVPGTYWIHRFIDLADGRWLAYAGSTNLCVVLGRGDVTPSRDSPVVAAGIMDLVECALRDGPLFFDAASFRAEKTLSDYIAGI